MAANKKISHNTRYQNSRIPKSAVVFYALIFVFIILFNSYLNIKPSSSAPSTGSTKQNQTPKAGETDTPPTFEKGGVNPPLSMEEYTEEADEENEELLAPPQGVTRAERMAWFRTQLPKLEILKSSDNSSALFHNRVLSFLSTQNCSTFFHAIWLSPARYFGQREFMTMDTLLKVHPQGCLMILSRSMDSELGNGILKPLVDRGLKVLAITPDLPFLVKNTPAEAWLEQLKSGKKDPGSVPLFNNLSNLMRLAVLYKYGGVYLDIDLIFLRDISGLRNAIGAQHMDPVTRRWLRLNNAVMIFDKNHPILLDFLEEFALTFDGDRWGHNGPYMVSRVVGRVGSTPGYNLTILPPKAFYPVDWNRIGDFYKKPQNESGSVWVENKIVEILYGGETYTLHLWNKRTRKLEIEEGSVMARVFRDHCVVCYNVNRT